MSITRVIAATFLTATMLLAATSQPVCTVEAVDALGCTTLSTFAGTGCVGPNPGRVTDGNCAVSRMWEGNTLSTSIRSTGIAVNPLGGEYISGFLAGPITFPGLPTLTPTGQDAFVLKVNSVGTPIWAKIIGNTGTEQADVVAADLNGNVFLGGIFTSALDFGGGVRAAPYNFGTDSFLAEYDANGAWVRDIEFRTTTGVPATISDIDTDALGNFYLAITTTQAMALGGACGTTTAIGGRDALFAKYNSSGVCQWARQLGGASTAQNDNARAISGNATGIAVAGIFVGSDANFGDGIPRASVPCREEGFPPAPCRQASIDTWTDIFISKFDAAGNNVWVRTLGAEWVDKIYDIKLMDNGDVFVPANIAGDNTIPGNTRYAVDYGCGTLPADTATPSGLVLLLLRYSSTSSTICSFVKAIQENNDGVSGKGIISLKTVDNGDVVIGGTLNSRIDFGGGAIGFAGGNAQPYAAKYTSTGSYKWSKVAIEGNAESGSNFGMDINCFPNNSSTSGIVFNVSFVMTMLLTGFPSSYFSTAPRRVLL